MVTGEMIRSKGEKTTQSSKAWKTRYFLIYSLLFVGMALLVFWPYIENHKSFVWVVDGVHQHFRAMVLYSRWLKTIAQNLFVNHVFEIPTFSFSIGYGSDILTTLNYYMIGDPLTFFAGFVPEKYLLHFYDFLTIFRIYLSGVVFSLFCFYREKKNTVAILCGSFIYAFSGYALFALRHPFFLNAMIYLPLVLLGVEMIIREKKTWLLTFSVFICAISNFYFFYMIACFTVVYVLLRVLLLCLCKQQKEAFSSFGRITYSSVLGVLLGAFLLFPVILVFLKDERRGTDNAVSLFYGAGHYKEVIKGFVSFNNPDAYCILGYSAFILIAIFLLYRCGRDREHHFLQILFPILTCGLIFPAVGYALNGFAYVTCRFIFGYTLLIAYIVVVMWDSFLEVPKKMILECMLVLVLYVVLCIVLGIWINNNMYSTLLVGFIVLLLFLLKPKDGRDDEWKRIKAFALMFGILCSVYSNGSHCNSSNAYSYHNSFLRLEDFEEKLYSDESKAVAELNDMSGFARYSGTYITRNASAMTGASSTQYYWSLSDPRVFQFQSAVGNLDNVAVYNYSTLDDRTILNALTAVKYFVNRTGRNENRVPYGYSPLKQENSKFDIYENQNALPFAYTYSEYIGKDVFEDMNPLEKEECMLHAVVSKEALPIDRITDYDTDLKSIPYQAQIPEGMRLDGNLLFVSSDNGELVLFFDGLTDSETYLLFEGLQYGYLDENGVFISKPEHGTECVTVGVCTYEEDDPETEITNKDITLPTVYSRNYTGRTDFAVNLNYSKAARKRIALTFSNAGVYRWENMEVVCNTLNHFEEEIHKRRSDIPEQLDLHNSNAAFATQFVTGCIELAEDKAFVLNIPYSDGWTAYVDGEKQKTFCANLMFTGLNLDKGRHEVKLVYHTPGLRFGTCVSCIALAILIAIQVKKKTMGEEVNE